MSAIDAGSGDPLVTVVTPSFNQSRFLGAAIDSVLSQDYPHIEHVIVDGGSSDESREVLAAYGDRVAWTSEPDAGQSNAINKGFRRARGSILTWLNSDDVCPRGAIAKVVDAFESHPEVGLVYGNGTILDADGVEVGDFDGIEPFSLWRLVNVLDYILQPAAFFRRQALRDAGMLGEDLDFAMDWDLWIRIAASWDVLYLQEHLGCSRVWAETKTSTGGWRRIRELRRLAARHSGRAVTPGVGLYALDTLGRRLGAGNGSVRGRLLGRSLGWLGRTISDRLPLHRDGWLGPRGKLLVPRRWGGVEVGFEAHRLPRGRPLGVTIRAERAVLARAEALDPGPFSAQMALPPGSSPFVELDVRSDFSFRAPPDRRRLAVRCVRLGGWRGGRGDAAPVRR